MSQLSNLRRMKSIVFALPREAVKPGYSVTSFRLEQLNLSESDLESLFESIISRINDASGYRLSLTISGATSESVRTLITDHRGGLTIDRFASRYLEHFMTDETSHRALYIDFDDMCELTRIIIAQSVIVPAMLDSSNVHTINNLPYFVAIYDDYAKPTYVEYDYIVTWEILNAHNILSPA